MDDVSGEGRAELLDDGLIEITFACQRRRGHPQGPPRYFSRRPSRLRAAADKEPSIPAASPRTAHSAHPIS